MRDCYFAVCIFLLSLQLQGQSVDRLFIVTMDGLRWQELFGGAVDSMIANKDLCPDSAVISARFSAVSRIEAREMLMPWFWSTLAEEGQLYGNRWLGNKVNCSNRFWFSYPGYHEILCGFSDPAINSNAKKYNPNKTILEWLNEQEKYRGSVAAFGSWDVFPYIINDERSGIHVNAGFAVSEGEDLTSKQKILNTLQAQIPANWNSVRFDAFTHHYMMEYVKKNHPKVVYISYGETDDFAHDGRYDHYLKSAYQTDAFLGELWAYIQSDPFYAGQTSMILTTDHGRGYEKMEEWKSHGTIYEGSSEIWMGVIGPNVGARGEVGTDQQILQNQVAATAARLLVLDFASSDSRINDAIADVFR